MAISATRSASPGAMPPTKWGRPPRLSRKTPCTANMSVVSGRGAALGSDIVPCPLILRPSTAWPGVETTSHTWATPRASGTPIAQGAHAHARGRRRDPFIGDLHRPRPGGCPARDHGRAAPRRGGNARRPTRSRPSSTSRACPSTSACVMDGNGRWASARGLPAHRGARRRRGRAARRRQRRPRDRRQVDHRLRLLHRELAPPARRGALPHELQPVAAPCAARDELNEKGVQIHFAGRRDWRCPAGSSSAWTRPSSSRRTTGA